MPNVACPRAAVFVDAGHLIARLGELLHQTTERAALAVDHQAVKAALEDAVARDGAPELLRSYWYDAPPPGGDARAELPSLPGLTVRFGQLVGGRQKRVDAMIVADMVRLAWTGAISAAYLVAHDDDLIPAVASAKEAGVRVVLVELGEATPSHLRSESDAALLVPLDALRRAVARRAPEPAPQSALVDPVETAYAVAREFAARLLQTLDQATVRTLQRLSAGGGRIPAEIDAKLLDTTERHVGAAIDEQSVRQRMREGFWHEIDNTAQPNGQGNPHRPKPHAERRPS